MADPKTLTGKSAFVAFKSGGAGSWLTHSDVGLGDFSLTLDRGTVEQELVGETGNYNTQGALSADGSLTATKLTDTGVGQIIGGLVNAERIEVSGSAASGSTKGSLGWYLASCQVTGFDISIGDASTVSEGSIDFTVLDPQNLSMEYISGTSALMHASGTKISDISV